MLLLEPVGTAVPDGLVVVPTLVSSESHILPVQVMNMSDEDIWLRPRTRLGVLTHVDSVKSDESCEVQFQRISAATGGSLGSLRLCVDYRKLNSNTRRDAFPLARIDESFDAPRGAVLFHH